MGKKWKQWQILFSGSKITVDGDCSHEIKRLLLLGTESYDKPRQLIKKQRHHSADKDLYSQSYGFSSSHMWIWELDHKEGWAVKDWWFWTVALEKTLECLLHCKENQSILKEISPEYSFEGLMLKLKLQNFGHLMGRTNSLEKTLMLGRIEGGRKGDDRGWDGWMASLTQWTWVWVGSRSWWRTEKPVVLQSLGSQKVRQDWATELNWTELGHSLALPLGVEWKLTFSSPVATAEFSRFAGVLSVALSQHHLLGFEIAQLEFHHLY